MKPGTLELPLPLVTRQHETDPTMMEISVAGIGWIPVEQINIEGTIIAARIERNGDEWNLSIDAEVAK